MRLVKLLLIMSGIVGLAGCAATAPQKTQLQMREFQTRSFETTDERAVLKALVNVLQDDGYMIKQANTDLGLLSATKEVDIESTMEAIFASAFGGNDARWAKNSIIESTANVTGRAESCRVRVTFQMKKLNNKGEVMEVEQIDDGKHYQDFFAKVHKGIFLDVDQGL